MYVIKRENIVIIVSFLESDYIKRNTNENS